MKNILLSLATASTTTLTGCCFGGHAAHSLETNNLVSVQRGAARKYRRGKELQHLQRRYRSKQKPLRNQRNRQQQREEESRLLPTPQQQRLGRNPSENPRKPWRHQLINQKDAFVDDTFGAKSSGDTTDDGATTHGGGREIFLAGAHQGARRIVGSGGSSTSDGTASSDGNQMDSSEERESQLEGDESSSGSANSSSIDSTGKEKEETRPYKMLRKNYSSSSYYYYSGKSKSGKGTHSSKSEKSGKGELPSPPSSPSSSSTSSSSSGEENHSQENSSSGSASARSGKGGKSSTHSDTSDSSDSDSGDTPDSSSHNTSWSHDGHTPPPSKHPTLKPTLPTSPKPTSKPTMHTITKPTGSPQQPTAEPSSNYPTPKPSRTPATSSSSAPTSAPPSLPETKVPTETPHVRSNAPTKTPSSNDSNVPTGIPTAFTLSPITIGPTRDLSTATPTTDTDFPPLVWKGVGGCTPLNPCSKCQGDCDTDSDCIEGMDCFGRAGAANVPGCAAGGSGDVEGADYCYDPNWDRGPTVTPTSSSPTDYPPSSQPSSIPLTSPSVLPTSTSTPSLVPSTSLTPSVIAPPLIWKGLGGCSPTSPCGVCAGDCDVDADCSSSASTATAADVTGANTKNGGSGSTAELACYRRSDDEKVPGCATGGSGDIPGADYCYDVSFATPTSAPTTKSVTPTVAPSSSVVPSRSPQVYSLPTAAPEFSPEAHFLRSQARRSLASAGSAAPAVGPSVQELIEWCVSGAQAPDYYQLLLRECIPDDDASLTSHTKRLFGNNHRDSTNSITSKMKQMDQLWSIDSQGYVHSIFDYERCMMVPSEGVVTGSDSDIFLNVEEAPVEIGPCNNPLAFNQFYYDDSSMIKTLKLVRTSSIQNSSVDHCVTFLGGELATEGAPLIVAPCGEGTQQTVKYGWDYVPEEDIGTQPTNAPSVYLPRLRYQGRDACTISTPCQECTGDCDTDEDCLGEGTRCFQRERGDSTQVPGCSRGGPGDIPGADYCYNTSGPSYPTSAPAKAPELPLVWEGGEGCTVNNPCQACVGDCDEDADCAGLLKCFKRFIGDSMQVPGCAVGGIGDLPGGDYCHDPSFDSPSPVADIGNPVVTRIPTLKEPTNLPTSRLVTPQIPARPIPTRPIPARPIPARPIATDRRKPVPIPGEPSPLSPTAPGGEESVTVKILSGFQPIATPTSIKISIEEEPSSPSKESSQDSSLGDSSSKDSSLTDLTLQESIPTRKPTTRVDAGKKPVSTSPGATDSNWVGCATLDKVSSPSQDHSSTKHAKEGTKAGKSPQDTAIDAEVATVRTRSHATDHASTRWERSHPAIAKDTVVKGGAGQRTREHGSTRWEREHQEG